MLCFEVLVNGRKVATCGLHGHGLLRAGVQWNSRPGFEDLRLLLMGHEDGEPDRTLVWADVPPVKPGDAVTIRVVEAAAADPAQVDAPRAGPGWDPDKATRALLESTLARAAALRRGLDALEAKAAKRRGPPAKKKRAKR